MLYKHLPRESVHESYPPSPAQPESDILATMSDDSDSPMNLSEDPPRFLIRLKDPEDASSVERVNDYSIRTVCSNCTNSCLLVGFLGLTDAKVD